MEEPREPEKCERLGGFHDDSIVDSVDRRDAHAKESGLDIREQSVGGTVARLLYHADDLA